MGDIIVTEITMQAFEDVVLQPNNITSAMHLFTIDPPLPPGLIPGPISWDHSRRCSAETGKDRVYSVRTWCGRSVECVLTMAFSLNEHMDLFHGAY